LLKKANGKRPKARLLIDRTLARVPWLTQHPCPNLYAVGGSWRTLARFEMEMSGYPLRVIHRYRLALEDAREVAALVARQSRRSLAATPGISQRRIDVLPASAEVLDRLLDRLKPGHLVFSAFGLREGVNYAHLGAESRAVDPLLSTVREMATRTGRFPEHGDEIAAWTEPLFAEADLDRRLHLASCLLSDTGWRLHPDYRAEQSFIEILRYPAFAADHTERVFLALSVYARYTSGEPSGPAGEASHLIEPALAHRARTLGMACRLAHTLSGGVRGLLSRFPIRLIDDAVVLRCSPADQVLVSEVVSKRLDALARHLGLSARVETDSEDD
jgi:exopolyphosphatase/guanosine-5'-triphosphate,3'-diphosphate pyrophosphatase